VPTGSKGPFMCFANPFLPPLPLWHLVMEALKSLKIRVAIVFGKFQFFDSDVDDNMSLGRVCITIKKPCSIAETVRVIIHGMTFSVNVKEIGTRNTTIENDLECSDSEGDQENGDLSFNMEVNHNEILDDFIEDIDDSNGSVPPSFKKLGASCNDASPSYKLRSSKCSTSFGNFKSKYRKGFSFINEMNKMIEVGGALGYDV
nr:hypothetical protein [Tanacetum cinerariifolium]